MKRWTKQAAVQGAFELGVLAFNGYIIFLIPNGKLLE